LIIQFVVGQPSARNTGPVIDTGAGVGVGVEVLAGLGVLVGAAGAGFDDCRVAGSVPVGVGVIEGVGEGISVP
jgi:hypothetical protein